MTIYKLADIVFFGFAVYSFYFVIFKHFTFYKKNLTLQKIEAASITLVSIAGLLYSIFWIYETGSILLGDDVDTKNNFIQRFFGPYSFSLWLHPIMYLVTTQILRIKKVANNTILRIIISFLLFLNFEKYVIIVTSLHRDYLPSSWTMYSDYSFFGYIIADWLIKLLIFSSLLTITYLIKNRKSL